MSTGAPLDHRFAVDAGWSYTCCFLTSEAKYALSTSNVPGLSILSPVHRSADDPLCSSEQHFLGPLSALQTADASDSSTAFNSASRYEQILTPADWRRLERGGQGDPFPYFLGVTTPLLNLI